LSQNGSEPQTGRVTIVGPERAFRRLAIVNRGEPAMRAIHAVRELNEERANPVQVIALYTEPERHALFVREADERHLLGPATVTDGDGRRRSAYLNYEALERALVETGADAAWVGWGFVAEHPEFAELCERLGVVFVGPAPRTMRILGDKIEAKRLAEQAGVPVAPWSGGGVASVEEAIRHGETLGFPLMIKAAAGGGGRGMRRVERAEELASAFERARVEAEQAFGDPSVLIERVVGSARHVEVQLIADGQGGAWALGVRDCSCQRRHQKVVEESASPALSPEQEQELAASAVRLAKLAGYRGAGTVEFLYEPSVRAFSFMEVNTRLQVEHPVTEVVTGVDLVKLQLHIAAGGRLEGEPPTPRGHAIEVRLNAEDPGLGFTPTPGRVTLLRLPAGPGVRVDAGVAEGDVVPPDFDSMIAKIIAHGRTREEAIARLRRAVADTIVVIDGGATNQGFLLELLGRPELRAGTVDTGWLDRLQAEGDVRSLRHADTALLQAAIALGDAAKAADRARFYAFARRGRPQAEAPVSQTIELRYEGASYRFGVCELAPSRYQVEVDGVRLEAEVERVTEHECRISYGGRSYRTLTALQDADLLVEANGVPHRISRDELGLVRSHAPAVVVAIPVSVGDEVQAGDVVAVTESMKMESSLIAPVSGRVREVLVAANVHVGAGRPLVQIEPLGGESERAAGERVRFDAREPDAGAAPSGLDRLVWLVLGYDVGAGEVRRILDELLAAPLDLEGERRLLEVYADVRALNRPHAEETAEAQVLGSPQERLHAFLRSLDADAEGLRGHFASNLERALAHYGIEGLERTPALENACYRLFLSQQRADTARAAVQAVLRRHLERADELSGRVGDEFRGVLDRLESALAPREPGLAELARELRWRYFDQPLIEAAREEAYAEMQGPLTALADGPAGPERGDQMRALIDCAQPLAPLLNRCAGKTEVGQVLVEALTRRYYRIRRVDFVEDRAIGDVPFVVGRYQHKAARYHVLAAFAEPTGLPAALRALARHARSVPPGARVLADLYTLHDDRPASQDELATELDRLLSEAELPGGVERVTFTVAPPRVGDTADVISFSAAADGALHEHRDLRGLHPLMAERLDLWRFSNFSLERLPSAPDVYLFHAIARDNPRDERFVAVVEVHDLSAVRDETGRITALPELERMTQQGLEAIRAAQTRRTARNRLLWNRLWLYAWPTMEFDPDEARPVLNRLARLTAGLGMESVLVRARMRDGGGEPDRVLRFSNPAGRGVVMEISDPQSEPLRPLDEGAQRIVSARRRGMVHPAEIVKILAPERAGPGATIPAGEFTELDLDADGCLVRVDRPPATNQAGIVVGLVRNRTARHPEGMLRVVLLGDPTRALGALAEPECRRIIAALDLAERLSVPCEWFALSAGAKIAMDSGTENMDWVAAALRRIVHFTQAGGEINLVVSGINVGAQPYWNAEATMLMHTKGILVMTPQSAMVLTGKEALDYSGGVSAEDNLGIGGYERVMGPNGQAQYWAPDLAGACEVLLAYYERAYVAPGERFPRRAPTQDPPDRDIGTSPHWAPDSDLRTVGEIFAEASNPGRKKPFDIRAVMRAVADRDHTPLERWKGMGEAEVGVVWDAHLGGWPVAMLGIESRPLPRFGQLPADGPEQWTAGTLFPLASKKIARAINAASGRRPLVVLANLAGFDGSPESMRRLQLEYGAEIGRAIVNFDGPIAFCVISRFHGGAFVVFSRALNDNLETSALEGARASVIGGAPAAAVVFSREVDVRTRTDPRIAKLDERIASAEGAERQQLRGERDERWAEVRSEKVGELAAEFDATHSVQRAVAVGSVDRIVPASGLRPYLIDAVERGMRRTLDRIAISPQLSPPLTPASTPFALQMAH
jgi:acetyl/propionyl-CoA carboxylase alpha subunit/acetyl-CoA carboxylase carboxyltransferase component